MKIKTVLYMELSAEMAANQQALAVCQRMAELEAEARRVRLAGPPEVEPNGPGVVVLAWSTEAIDS